MFSVRLVRVVSLKFHPPQTYFFRPPISIAKLFVSAIIKFFFFKNNSKVSVCPKDNIMDELPCSHAMFRESNLLKLVQTTVAEGCAVCQDLCR